MRVYLVVMTILAALSAIFAIEDIGILLVYLTLGLAIPLLFVATLAYYGACLFPAFALWNRSRALGLALTVLLLGAAAWLPGFQGERAIAALEASLMTDEKIPAGPVGANTVEILFRSGETIQSGSGPCGNECRSLLLDNGVKWVRFVGVDRLGKEPPVVSVYRRATGADCAVPGFPSDGKPCVLAASGTGEPSELTLAFEPLPVKSRAQQSETKPVILEKARLVTATLRKDGSALEVYRHTELAMTAPMQPTVLTAFKSGMHSGGASYVRATIKRQPVTLASLLVQLGYSLTEPEVQRSPSPPVFNKKGEKPPLPQIDADLTRAVISLLDLPGTTPFTREQAQPLSRWTSFSRRQKDWTPEAIALLRKIIAEPRTAGIPLDLDSILVGNPDLAKALMPDVLDRLEAIPAGDTDYHSVETVAYGFGRFDPALIKAHEGRIVALAKRNDRTGNSALQAAISFGGDPRDFVPTLAWDKDVRDTKRRFTAMCYADDRWSSVVVGMVRSALETLPRNKPGSHHGYRRDLIHLLARHGALDDALNMAKPDDERQRKVLRRAADPSEKINRRCQT